MPGPELNVMFGTMSEEQAARLKPRLTINLEIAKAAWDHPHKDEVFNLHNQSWRISNEPIETSAGWKITAVEARDYDASILREEAP